MEFAPAKLKYVSFTFGFLNIQCSLCLFMKYFC